MRGIKGRSVVLATVVAVAAFAGCTTQSPKDRWISSTNKRCEDMTEQFTGDLAWGDGIGQDDLSKMDERAAQIRDLQAHARKNPPPEVNQRDLEEWLNQLGDYAKATQEMRGDFSNALPGGDMVRALSAAGVKAAAEETKPLAQRLGLDKCAQVERWEKLGS
ncbi:hypothetical protein [Actinomadura sp. 9N215]|uniref:hypothetical protein n=1 Tax=Actinomadura sp. 9N215 TaxID=3375150 RepID=UPI0037BADD83